MVLFAGDALIPILYLTQALNAILLLPLLVLMYLVGRDRGLMGALATGRGRALAQLAALVLVAGCVLALAQSRSFDEAETRSTIGPRVQGGFAAMTPGVRRRCTRRAPE